MKMITIKISSIYALLGLALCVAYGYFLSGVVFFWRYANPSSDIHNYIAGSDRYRTYLIYRTNTWLDYFSNEISFHYVFMLISDQLKNPVFALQLISFFSAALIFYNLFPRLMSSLPLFIFIFHPRVLDLVSSQQRFAFTVALFIIVVRHSQGIKRGLLSIPLATLHTFFIVPAFLLLLFNNFQNYLNLKSKYISLFLFCFLLIHGQQFFLNYIGDRRADIVDDQSFGLAYLFMWTLTYLTIVIFNKRIIENVFGFMFIFVSFLAVISSIHGLYSERYVSSSILFFLAYASTEKVKNTSVLSGIFFLNMSLSYYFWIENTF